MTRPVPAYINDPIMAGAFSAFMGWAWGQPDAHKAFCEATGTTRIAPATDPISILVDEATGAQEGYATAFIEWLIVNHWGEDGKVDEAAPLDPLPEAFASVLKASAAQTPHHGKDALSVRPNTNPSSKPREES